ncbi:MAG: hypothetical protein U9P81_03180 [Euryarchaeota archaeon]|nr:hypothetical protein [Euryarchaeota archaeon]
MERSLYIPNETLPDITKFLHLNQEHIEKLLDVLIDSENKTIIDILLAIVNEIKVSDDEAASIFSSYKYILLVLEENKLKFSQLIPEITYILDNSKIQDYEEIIANVVANSEKFSDLFSAKSMESRYAKKRFLSSEIYNSVFNINSVCDIRPLFDEEKNEILELLNSVHIEFTVQDSADNIKIIPLSFDEETFDNLVSEIENIKKKKSVINERISDWIED